MSDFLSYEAVGEGELDLFFQTSIERLSDLHPALLSSGVVAREEFGRRIDVGGDPPWPPHAQVRDADGNVLTLDHRLGFDTGAMRRSIEVDDYSEPNEVKVGVSGPARLYAFYFQNGTGVYVGHTPWTVSASAARALHWNVGGEDFFARSVVIKGQPPRPFVYLDQPLIDQILEIFRRFMIGKEAL